jgi:hypothetical protein
MDEQLSAEAVNRPDGEQAEEPSLGERVAAIVRQALEEHREQASRQQLEEERARRLEVEKLLEEARTSVADERARRGAIETERDVRSELARLGVGKLDLAWRAVRQELTRTEDGRLVAKAGEREEPAGEYLRRFVQENPELVPARLSGGSGTYASREMEASFRVDLNAIRPGMSGEDLERARREVARLAAQAFRPQY